MVSGGEVWEEVDLNNFPTDWVGGDRIKVSFKTLGSVAGSGWGNTISALNISTDNNMGIAPIELKIPGSDSPLGYNRLSLPISYNYNSSSVSIVGIAEIYANDSFNGTNGTICFNLQVVAFNGASKSETTTYATRSNLSTYVNKMWRLKK